MLSIRSTRWNSSLVWTGAKGRHIGPACDGDLKAVGGAFLLVVKGQSLAELPRCLPNDVVIARIVICLPAEDVNTDLLLGNLLDPPLEGSLHHIMEEGREPRRFGKCG